MFISMHSILGWGSFCMNYCINVAWHGGHQPVALLRCNEAQVASIAAFRSSALLVLVSLIFLLTIVQVRRVCWPIKHSNTMVIEPAFGTFGSVVRCQVLLENEISISIKLVSRRKWSEAQIITDCGNFTLDFKQHGFCVSSLFLQTLESWFPNEMQNVLSSEKRTLDHWATVQFFFSLAQVRCFWRCLCFRSGLVTLFLKMSEHGDSWCTDSSFSSLLVKLSQVFESALLDSILKLAVIPVACAHFPTQFLPSSQLCM